ncbi:MAG: hypothetical protein JO051_07970 [Acidobacteriaceae bacterium]|nr:hypothetical protein [Acidobacteriaceae bacterium]
MTAVMAFTCSICGESSHEICVYCTKDTCDNHMCQKCHGCSDCCVCETPVIREREAEPAFLEEPPVDEPEVEEQAAVEEEGLEGMGL